VSPAWIRAVTAAARTADFAFWVSDDDGESVRLATCFASTAQAIDAGRA